MNEQVALGIVEKIFSHVFDRKNDWNLEQIFEKFAFDLKLPQKVSDKTDGSITWADATASGQFITQENMQKWDNEKGWMREKRELGSLDDVIAAWREINFTSTERSMDSINVSESDTIYRCENVYHSTNSFGCKNLVFCDSMDKSEYTLACSRSTTTTFSIRVDDSQKCSNSYSVIYSNKIINSFFIQDSFDLYECMFCSHIACKKYCIANMQFSKSEYFTIKQAIIDWILSK